MKDAEKVIEDIDKEIRQELAAEIAIITDQFEKRKQQIMEKAKKDAGDKTARITDNIREAFANQIEQASTNTISEAIEQADHRIKELVRLLPAVEAKVVKDVSADKILAREAGISQVKGKNVAEAANGGKPAKNDKKDEIAITTISMEGEEESKQDFNDWLRE